MYYYRVYRCFQKTESHRPTERFFAENDKQARFLFGKYKLQAALDRENMTGTPGARPYVRLLREIDLDDYGKKLLTNVAHRAKIAQAGTP